MDSPTKERVVHLVLHNGPQTAGQLAESLDLTPAAVRRHLAALEADGTLEAREERVYGERGRGRPSKVFVLTDKGRSEFHHEYDALAIAALRRLCEHDRRQLAKEQAASIEARFLELRSRTPDRPAVEVLVDALQDQHFAAALRRVPRGDQIVQYHCPVSEVAAEFPILCEIETQLFGRLLDTHLQRLATIAHGDGMCTTHIPAPIPTPILKRK